MVYLHMLTHPSQINRLQAAQTSVPTQIPSNNRLICPNTPAGGFDPLNRPPTSAIMTNATRDWAYPPVSLPKREFMERARQIWEEEGLPPLTPKAPWFGYSLGYWTEEDVEEADLALKGEHYKTGEKLTKKRLKG